MAMFTGSLVSGGKSKHDMQCQVIPELLQPNETLQLVAIAQSNGVIHFHMTKPMALTR